MSSVAQSCPILCKPVDCSPPDSSVHRLQARILEWLALTYSMGSSQPRDWTHIFCSGRRILYHCTTWEAQGTTYTYAGKYWTQKKRAAGWDGWKASLTQWTWTWQTPGLMRDRRHVNSPSTLSRTAESVSLISCPLSFTSLFLLDTISVLIPRFLFLR